MTQEQKNLVRVVADAIVDSVKEAGDHGAPGGIIYMALMARGASLDQYQAMMNYLVNAGRLRRAGDLYFVA
jgi:hypothetical protein